jgi:hypothetical protein
VSRHFDDLDAVLEFDALDDFGELISPFNRRHVFAAALTIGHAVVVLTARTFFDRQLGIGASRNRIETFSVCDETIFTLTCVFGLNGPHLQQADQRAACDAHCRRRHARRTQR